MKNRALSLLLALGLIAGLFPFGLQANAVEPAPTFPIFLMKVVANVTGALTDGEEFTAGIYGGPLDAESAAMVAFQINLQYPAEKLELLRIEPEGACAYNGLFEQNPETGHAAYSIPGKEGILLQKGGTLLATAVFRVRPIREDSEVRIGLDKGTEITRPIDKDGQPVNRQQSEAVKLHHIPELQLPAEGAADSGKVEVTLHNNPAGTLFTAVYKNGGQLLRCAVTPDVPANAPKQTVAIDLSGGAFVKTFLLDSKTSRPLCAAAKMTVK